jgi:hypothetical protein
MPSEQTRFTGTPLYMGVTLFLVAKESTIAAAALCIALDFVYVVASIAFCACVNDYLL